MLQKSKGIIFRSTKYSETSLILDIYTVENGLGSYIISGVRKSKSKLSAAILRPFSIVEFLAYVKNNDSLSRIKEAKLSKAYEQIPFDVIRSSLALFIIDVCRNAIKEKTGNFELFHFIEHQLLTLDAKLVPSNNFHLYFMINLAGLLGFGIQNNYSQENAYFNLEQGAFSNTYLNQYSLEKELSNKLHNVILDLEKKDRRINNMDRNKLLDALILFYKYHLEGFGKIKSHEVLRTVLS